MVLTISVTVRDATSKPCCSLLEILLHTFTTQAHPSNVCSRLAGKLLDTLRSFRVNLAILRPVSPCYLHELSLCFLIVALTRIQALIIMLPRTEYGCVVTLTLPHVQELHDISNVVDTGVPACIMACTAGASTFTIQATLLFGPLVSIARHIRPAWWSSMPMVHNFVRNALIVVNSQVAVPRCTNTCRGSIC